MLGRGLIHNACLGAQNLDTNYFQQITQLIASKNPVVAKTVQTNLALFDDAHLTAANHFLSRYVAYLDSIGLDIGFAVSCYLKLLAAMMLERKAFIETGRYSNDSYRSVNESIYSNPEVMDYHMHGLAIAQFLWPDQYERFRFFANVLPEYKHARTYLEVGGGHGLYALTAREVLAPTCSIDVIDISDSSLRLAKGIIDSAGVNFIHSDFFNFDPVSKFDFITLGEVIEHVEDPLRLLGRVREILNANGTVFLSTPANAPMIDHIFLFNNVDEIRCLLVLAGFCIQKELVCYPVGVSPETANKQKLPIMYAAFLR